MFRAWLPFDTTTNMGYTIATLLQGITCLNVVYNICFLEVIGVWAINQASLHLHVIKEKFKNLGMDRKNLNDDDKFQRTMANEIDRLVRDHQDVIL